MKFIYVFFLPVLLLTACSGGSGLEPPPETPPCAVTGGSNTVTVSWVTGRSFDVNTAVGGGHKIYYSSTPGITKSTLNVVDVPNSSSLTTGTITGLNPGCTIYVRVGAYSAINSAGGNLSAESSITP